MHRVIFTNESDTVWPSEDIIKRTGPDRTQVQMQAQKSYQAKVFNIDTTSLRGFGLPQEAISPAIQALTAVAPIMMNFRVLAELSARLQELCTQMNVQFPLDSLNHVFSCSTGCLAQYKDASGQVSKTLVAEIGRSAKPSLILSNHRDGESIAGSRLFSSILTNLKGPKQTWIEDQDLTGPDYATFVSNCRPANVLMLCSQGAFEDAPLLARLGLLVKCQQKRVDMLPVVIGATFDFAEASATMIQEVLKLKLGTNPSERLSELAGDKVTYQEISDAVEYSLTFPISFINVPQLSEKKLQDMLRGLLESAKRVASLRASQLGLGGSADVLQEAPKPAKQKLSDPPVADSVKGADNSNVEELGDDTVTTV